MEIKIEFTEERLWSVYYQDKSAVMLGFEEMLGLIASITMPTKRNCLQWLKTEEENKQYF